MILITGGTGSFGRACVKKLLEMGRDRIVVYSRDEHKQEQMRQQIGETSKIRYFIGDVRDRDRLRLATNGCLYVIHAAAMKIVPTAEYNPMECVKTNILGAQNLIDIMLEYSHMGTRRVLALSTDKAVNPLNLYGATKLCAEKLFIASNVLAEPGPRAQFSVVRYGNVANSNGSVIPLFRRQVAYSQPLTITHKDMTRFWITLDEAVAFTIKNLYKMDDDYGQNWGGKVFIPKMPSFRVEDLADAIGGKDYPRVYIGVRPGEKIHEQIDQETFSDRNDTWLNAEQLESLAKSL